MPLKGTGRLAVVVEYNHAAAVGGSGGVHVFLFPAIGSKTMATSTQPSRPKRMSRNPPRPNSAMYNHLHTHHHPVRSLQSPQCRGHGCRKMQRKEGAEHERGRILRVRQEAQECACRPGGAACWRRRW
jgi:hypothetical protein